MIIFNEEQVELLDKLQSEVRFSNFRQVTKEGKGKNAELIEKKGVKCELAHNTVDKDGNVQTEVWAEACDDTEKKALDKVLAENSDGQNRPKPHASLAEENRKLREKLESIESGNKTETKEVKTANVA